MFAFHTTFTAILTASNRLFCPIPAPRHLNSLLKQPFLSSCSTASLNGHQYRYPPCLFSNRCQTLCYTACPENHPITAALQFLQTSNQSLICIHDSQIIFKTQCSTKIYRINHNRLLLKENTKIKRIKKKGVL